MPQSKINESLVCSQTVDKTEDRSISSISFIQKTQKDINLLTSGKAPGIDSIPAKVCKDGSPRLSEIMIGFFSEMWNKPSRTNYLVAENFLGSSGCRCDNDPLIYLVPASVKYAPSTTKNILHGVKWSHYVTYYNY